MARNFSITAVAYQETRPFLIALLDIVQFLVPLWRATNNFNSPQRYTMCTHLDTFVQYA